MKRSVALLALLAQLGCSHGRPAPDERCPSSDAGTPIDPVLLAFLSRARAAHHLADEGESGGNLPAAIEPLAALVAGPRPTGGAPEVREVLADSYARLADLRSQLGAFEAALADVRAGLEQAREPNYFQGHLLETEGLIEERHAKALEATDPKAAAALRERAIGLLEQAMQVQAGVIDAARPHGAGGKAEPAGSARGNAPPR